MTDAQGESMRRPSEATRAAEAREAGASHRADRPPTSEEEELADELGTDPSLAEHRREVAEHVSDMAERGAAEQGEGRVP